LSAGPGTAYIDSRRPDMNASALPRILVCANQMTTLAELRHLLRDGHEVGGHLLGMPDPDDLAGYQLVVVEGRQCGREALDLCRRFRGRLEESFVPLLFLTDDHNPEARLASFESGADTYLLHPFTPEELRAQVRAFLRIKETHDRL